MPKMSISSLLVNRLINTRGNEKRATDVNKWKTTPIAFFPISIVPFKFNRRRTTDVSCYTSNWLDWKIQQEIMRSDMPKRCWRWKAWGYHECSKKCRAASRLDEPYIHGKHIKSNLFECYQPRVSFIGRLTLTWPKTNKATVYCSPLQSKYGGKETSHYSFIPPI